MDATTFFLTYPRTNITHDAIYEALHSIKPVVWARVAREQHQDDGWHIHAIVRFGARVKTRSNMALFDISGRHPNIQVPRRLKDVLEYVSKDGDFKDYGPVPSKTNAYEQLINFAKSGERDGFDKCCLENRVSFMWAEHLWKRHGQAGHDILEPGAGTECMQLQTLQFTNKSTIIVGPSGCGKSTWAKRVSQKPALWVTHLDDLKKLSKEHKCIIFDDMDFKHLPRSTQIYLADQDDIRTIHCRNTNATIPAGLPKIFTANSYPFEQDEAIARRVTTINIISWTF
jgi:hypothetical protein